MVRNWTQALRRGTGSEVRLTASDHILATLLALACVVQLLATVDPESLSRSTLYKAGALSGLFFGVVPLLFWVLAGRPIAGFGLGAWLGHPAPVLAAAAGWALLLGAVLMLVRRGVLRGPLVRLYRRYAYMMPRSRSELGASWLVSILAGGGEEIAFRGFLLWYGVALLGAPGGLAATSLLFGAAHSYQRRLGMVFATGAGLVLGAAYLASSSLLLVMFMHATWNIGSFAAGRILLASTGGRASGQL